MADRLPMNGPVEFGSTVSVAGVLTHTDTTDATSKTAGAAKFAGGIAVDKKIHAGEKLTVDTGGLTVTAGGLQSLELKHQYVISGSTGIVNLSGSATHTAVANHMYALTRLAGCTLTLPTPTVIGQKIKVIVTPNTSNSNIINTAEADQLYEGYAHSQPSANAQGPSGSAIPYIFHPDVSNDDSITMNGTTTGGTGTIVLTATSVAAGAERWMVQAELFGSGTMTTPFS